MSHSSSVSSSESCCADILCACEDWLTAFCDYETVTLDYCGEQTEFYHARSSGIKMSSVNPQAGVHAADKIFRLSMLENSVEVGIGGTITDSDGVEWVIYSVTELNLFCLKVMHVRSVAACFNLTEDIDVFDLDCTDCGECDNVARPRRVGRVKGKILAETGSLQTRNDSKDLVYNFSGSLVRWPLSVRPSASHRLKDKYGSYRITRVTDNGVFVPYIVGLEADNVLCHVR
jgi:hypothetical protein